MLTLCMPLPTFRSCQTIPYLWPISTTLLPNTTVSSTTVTFISQMLTHSSRYMAIITIERKSLQHDVSVHGATSNWLKSMAPCRSLQNLFWHPMQQNKPLHSQRQICLPSSTSVSTTSLHLPICLKTERCVQAMVPNLWDSTPIVSSFLSVHSLANCTYGVVRSRVKEPGRATSWRPYVCITTTSATQARRKQCNMMPVNGTALIGLISMAVRSIQITIRKARRRTTI